MEEEITVAVEEMKAPEGMFPEGTLEVAMSIDADPGDDGDDLWDSDSDVDSRGSVPSVESVTDLYLVMADGTYPKLTAAQEAFVRTWVEANDEDVAEMALNSACGSSCDERGAERKALYGGMY